MFNLNAFVALEYRLLCLFVVLVYLSDTVNAALHYGSNSSSCEIIGNTDLSGVGVEDRLYLQ